MTERLVVIGGDAAGMSAASQARRLKDSTQLEIIAFEKGPYTSYGACGIPYWISGMIESADDLIARSPETFRTQYDIDARTRHEVVAIDTDAREVTVHDLDADQTATHGYDELLIATGATPTRPPLPGIDSDGVFGVQTLDDGRRLLDALDDRAPRRAIVLGAGYIGLEMAEAMVLRGLEVHVVEAGSQPMATLEARLGQQIADAMRGMGMHLHLDTRVEGFEVGDDGWVTAAVTPDEVIETDLVVLGIGARPFTDLAEDAGVPIGPSGGIVTDRRQRTPVAGVWAAGDCAETFHRVAKRPVSIALGTIANKQGRVAGRNLGGSYAAFPGVLGTAVTKVCDLEIGRTGLHRADAEEAGFEVVTATIDASTRAGYYPGAQPITVKLLAEHDTGRLLGAQIVGNEGAAKRIDVLAAALWNDMTVEDLVYLDVSYSPPFAPVWDPVLVAARRAASAVADAR